MIKELAILIWDWVTLLGPYLLCAAIGAGVCWFDIHKVCEDRLIHVANPLYYGASRTFIAIIGFVAFLIYLTTSHEPIEGTGIATFVTWNAGNPWYRAVTVGASTIVIIRSRLWTLQDNRAFGFDAVYTKWRDRAVDIVCVYTVARRRDIVRLYRDKFVQAEGFAEDFKAIVDQILKQCRQTAAVRSERSQIENITSLTDGNSSRDYIISVHAALIRSAVTYGRLNDVHKLLERKLQSGRFHR